MYELFTFLYPFQKANRDQNSGYVDGRRSQARYDEYEYERQSGQLRNFGDSKVYLVKLRKSLSESISPKYILLYINFQLISETIFLGFKSPKKQTKSNQNNNIMPLYDINKFLLISIIMRISFFYSTHFRGQGRNP